MAHLSFNGKRLQFPGEGILEYNYTPTVTFPTRGLESYWGFEEASGTVFDLTSNTNNLTTDVGITYQQAGKIDDYSVSVSSTGYLQGTEDTIGTVPVSISAWIKTPDLGTERLIFDCNDWNTGYHFQVSTSGALGFTAFNGTGNGVTGANVLDDDQWHHVVVTQDGTAAGTMFYVDNVADDPGSNNRPTLANLSDTFRVGNWVAATSKGFDGEIDSMAVYSVVLTTEEIASLWNGGAGISYP